MNREKFRRLIDKSINLFELDDPTVHSLIKEQVAVQEHINAGLKPYTDDRYFCGTCGSSENHPKTGVCFNCGSDNWNIKGTEAYKLKYVCVECEDIHDRKDDAILCCAETVY